MTEGRQDWALVLGSSSGFGAAVSIELAKTGMSIFGVHWDRRETQPLALNVQERIREAGGEAVFFNRNAGDAASRAEVAAAIVERGVRIRVFMHSLAFGSLKPLVGADRLNQRQIEMTVDLMGNSLVYWVQDLVAAKLLGEGSRIYAMTSEGGGKAVPQYGAVSAAKAVLEAHIRQLALELAPLGVTANAILAGVTDTPALRKIPGNEVLIEHALARNPHKRLTTPEDVAKCVAVLSHENTYWMTGNTIRVDGGENSIA
jgi:NAD(P)-dependent dehydrogenase (short-subunit alcohol dehydrogenase family)